MKRSIWKGLYIHKYLLQNKFKQQRKKEIWSRSSTIPGYLVGQYVNIHNGKEFLKTFITREKVGFKFGEFAFSRKFTKKLKKTQTSKKK